MPRLAEIGLVVLEKKIFLKSSMHFRIFLIISPWKRTGSFMLPLHPRMLCAKFGWNWPRSSREYDFSNLLMYFRNFVFIPLGKGQSPSFEQIWIPCTHRWFLPSFDEIDSTILENIFFYLSMYFCNFVIISPCKKGGALYLNKIEPPLPKDELWQVWLKLVRWFMRRRF